MDALMTLDYKSVGRDMYFALQDLRKDNPDGTIVQVCGPISSGGLGNIEENLYKLRCSITTMKQNGYIVFDQTPFEDRIAEIKQNRFQAGLFKEYDWLILYQCYEPLFGSTLFDLVVFIQGYKSSKGAMWELFRSHYYKISHTLFDLIPFQIA